MRRIKNEIYQMALLGIVDNCRLRTALLRRVPGDLGKEKYFYLSFGFHEAEGASSTNQFQW